MTIASGASAEVCFSFNPPVTQQYDGQATLETSDGLNAVVQFTGWGGGPQISCLPKSIAFGQTLDYSTSVVPILCTNVGSPGPGLDVVAVEIVPSVPGLSAWLDSPESDGGFGAGVTIQIDVSYTPINCNDFGFKATIILETSPGKPGLEIPITGQALCPPCELAISPPSLDFGNVGVGETSPILTTSIQNVGSFPCEIDGFKIEGDSTNSFQIVSTSVQPDRDAGQLHFSVSDQCPAPAPLQSITLQSGPGDSVPQYAAAFGPTLPALISPGSPLTYLLSCTPSSPGDHPAQLILSDGYVDTLLWLTCSSP